ncbi:MAG: TRAP transporter small permease subunit [Burkholderiaceae bacterium]|nr:TRAP transporter small permease subunit [Burkholderiaceae bacterium]
MRRYYERLLAIVTIALLIALAAIVLYAVAARTLGASPIWYDEVASVVLAWLSLLGAALAMARNAHLNFENLLMAQPLRVRGALFLFAELVVLAVFSILLWVGWRILEVFGDETLTSLTWVPLAVVHAIVPVGAALTILARLLVARENWQRVMEGRDSESEEIAAEIARAQAELARHGGGRSR